MRFLNANGKGDCFCKGVVTPLVVVGQPLRKEADTSFQYTIVSPLDTGHR